MTAPKTHKRLGQKPEKSLDHQDWIRRAMQTGEEGAVEVNQRTRGQSQGNQLLSGAATLWNRQVHERGLPSLSSPSVAGGRKPRTWQSVAL